MIFLSIVIPAYNEENAIRAGKLKRVSAWLGQQPFASEIILVDDGSQDATAELARLIATQVIRIPHAGKASAVLIGIQQAKGDIVLFTDMDQATPITETGKLLDALNHGADIAIGSRGLVRAGAPAWRYILSWGQMALQTLLLGICIVDSQCGFKAMRRLVVLDIIEHLWLYHPGRIQMIRGSSVASGFDVELLLVGHRLGYRISEIPVMWNYQETRHVNLAKDMWNGIMDLMNISVANLKGLYPWRK